MKPLKIFAIGAEVTVISTLAVASYHVAFAGTGVFDLFARTPVLKTTGATADLLAGMPILTVIALESLRLPVAFNLSRSKLTGFFLSCLLLAGLSVITGEAAIIAYENLIFQRTRSVAEAERDLTKAEDTRANLKTGAMERYETNLARLKDALEKARAYKDKVANTPVTKQEMPRLQEQTTEEKPVTVSIPAPLWCPVKKGKGKHICNAPAIAEAHKQNDEAARKAQEANEKARQAIIDGNNALRDKVAQQNKDAQQTHDKDLSDANAQVQAAQANLDAVGSAPDMHGSDAAVEAAQQRVIEARAMNPMFRVAAAWQKMPCARGCRARGPP
jgi:hypothetical protein